MTQLGGRRPAEPWPDRQVAVTAGPFRRGGSQDLGVTPGLLRGPGYRQVFHGIHVAAAVPDDTWTRARAALLVAHPGAVVSHSTAALLWGGIVPHDPSTHVTVHAARLRHKVAELRFHVCQSLVREDLVRGVPVTSPEQTFVDLARSLGLVDMVVLGDSLVHAGRTTPARLVGMCHASRLKGAVAARRAAAYVRVGAASAMESRQRMLMVLAGLPEPELQIAIRDRQGTVVYRIDMGYRRARLGFEYDGRQHAEDERQWAHDLMRREDLDAIGWRILVNRSRDIYGQPEHALQRAMAAMRSRGVAVPVRLNPAWRRHFPGHSSGLVR